MFICPRLGPHYFPHGPPSPPVYARGTLRWLQDSGLSHQVRPHTDGCAPINWTAPQRDRPCVLVMFLGCCDKGNLKKGLFRLRGLRVQSVLMRKSWQQRQGGSWLFKMCELSGGRERKSQCSAHSLPYALWDYGLQNDASL